MRETLRKEVRLVKKVIISRHAYDLHALYLGEQRMHAGDATPGGSPVNKVIISRHAYDLHALCLDGRAMNACGRCYKRRFAL